MKTMIEIAFLFLRMGVLSFGGPIAAMALLEQEFADKRKWISSEHFAEIYTVLKLLPGALSSQMAIYIGTKRAGLLGGLVAGICYILPAFLMLLALSVFYVRTGGMSSSESLLGFQLGALVVIFQSTLILARPYRTQRKAWVIALASFLLVYHFPRYEPLILIAFGVLGVFLARRSVRALRASRAAEKKSVHAFGAAGLKLGSFGLLAGTMPKLFWMCFKSGAFVFGSGLAIVPLLEGDAVGHFHWLTHQQFMDGLALGQITPGPVVITATFIGYMVAAIPGAVLATVAIFLPSFVNIFWILPRIWKRISVSPYSPHFTGFAIPAVIGAIFSTTFRLGAVSLVNAPAWGILFLALVLSQATRIPGWALILGSGALGFVFH